MERVMELVADSVDCEVAELKPHRPEESGEHLGIDAMFFDRAEYERVARDDQWDPLVIPKTVVELENRYDHEKIKYCLWKVLCIRAPLKVLICYQDTGQKVQDLTGILETVIWEGNLMEDSNSDLLIVVGDDSKGEETPWRQYFRVFEWRGGRLEPIVDK